MGCIRVSPGKERALFEVAWVPRSCVDSACSKMAIGSERDMKQASKMQQARCSKQGSKMQQAASKQQGASDACG